MQTQIRTKLAELSREHDSLVLFDYPISRHSSIGIGGPAGAWYIPSCVEELKQLKGLLNESGIDTVVIGMGSNVLFPDNGLDRVIISLSNDCFTKMTIQEGKVSAGAGIYMGNLIYNCCQQGLTGLEGVIGIPGTLGGAVFMNASYVSAISDYLEQIKILD